MLFLVVITARTGVHSGFVVRAYSRTKHPVIVTRKVFRLHLGVPRNKSVPCVPTLVVFGFDDWKRLKGTLRGRGHGVPGTLPITENVQLVRGANERSPRRSAWKRAFASGML